MLIDRTCTRFLISDQQYAKHVIAMLHGFKHISNACYTCFLSINTIIADKPCSVVFLISRIMTLVRLSARVAPNAIK